MRKSPQVRRWSRWPAQRRWGWAGLACLILILSACQRPAAVHEVVVEVDHGRRTLTTDAATVREVLAVAGIELGELDRVEPDLYAQIRPEMTIRVIRVEEKLETERVTIPFEQRTVVNESLPLGERRLVQLGVNGEEEITMRIVLEDGVEVGRTEISRLTVVEPVEQIIVVGAQGEDLASVPVEGTVAYLAGGNAWVLRDSSRARRPLTTEGDLDGRVFSLSPDGRQLVYTRRLAGDVEAPLNQLWLISTTVVGEKPISLPVRNVLYAEWSPVLTDTRLAFSTGERVASAPGWRANNDLWLLDLSDPEAEPVELVPANTAGVYPWWGTSFKWSPTGRQIAYARADQVGVIDLAGGRTRPLLDYPPLQTFGDWVWVPGLAWSPNGEFLATIAHGSPLAAEPPEESPVFDLWLLAADRRLQAKAAERVGMWSDPSWGAAGIVFGRAVSPLASVDSRYELIYMDHDGSNQRRIFPQGEGLGVALPQIAWSPDGRKILFIHNGNLFLQELNGTPARQLTTDGQATHLTWVTPAAPLQPAVLSGSESLSGTVTSTGTPTITVTAPPTLLATPEDVSALGGGPTPATTTPAPTAPAATATLTGTPPVTVTRSP